MKHWSTFLIEHISLFQKDTNEAAGDDKDLTSAMWVKELMVNSNEPALIQRTDEKFEKFDLMEQGVITYMKIALDNML